MKIMLWILLALLAVVVLGVVWVRVAGDDPAMWHVDPVDAPRSARRNSYVIAPDGMGTRANKVAPVYSVSPQELGERLAAIALAEPRTTLLAGSPEDGWFTLVQRSNLMRYPDYISIRVLPVESGSTMAIFSRSRYGYSDRGVNKARLRRWLKLLEPMQK